MTFKKNSWNEFNPSSGKTITLGNPTMKIAQDFHNMWGMPSPSKTTIRIRGIVSSLYKTCKKKKELGLECDYEKKILAIRAPSIPRHKGLTAKINMNTTQNEWLDNESIENDWDMTRSQVIDTMYWQAAEMYKVPLQEYREKQSENST